jgi:hypothetical protein
MIKKIVVVLSALLILTACTMERPTIERGFNVVFSKNDYWYFDQEGGMSNKILPSGKQELSTGYNTAYYIPTTQQNFSFGELSILMKERVGRKFNINFGYKVIKGADLKLVINYLPQSDAEKVSSEDLGIDRIDVDLNEVFSTNILPFAKQIIMDTVDNESLYAVNTEKLAATIDRKLNGMLSGIMVLERVVDDTGNIILSGNTISITDVIDINSINIVPGEMPAIVKKEVGELTDLQAELKSAKEDLKIETNIKSEELLEAAGNAKSENDALASLLENPMFVKYQKLQQFKGIVEQKVDADGKPIKNETKTKIIFYQQGMSADDAANLVRSAQ